MPVAVVQFRVQDLSDLELRLVVDHDRWRRGLYSTRNRVGGCRLQHRHMEDRVDRTKAVRESRGDREGPRLHDDLVGPQELVGQLLGWPSRTEELSFDESLATNRKGWGRQSPRVRGSLIVFLSVGHVCTEFHMQLVQVSNELIGAGRREVAFRMHHKVGVVAFVGKEWCDASGGTGSVVVCELREG